MRTLLIAHDCNPDWPSLPVVGFKACRAIAEQVPAVVVTHVRNRPQIERDGMGKAEVVYVSNEYLAWPMCRLSRLIRGGTSVAWTANIAFSYLPYLAFECEVWRRFRHDLRAGRFDIVHRVTPMSPTLPSPMASWSPVPFVLGPLNGGLRWPAGFASELHREREWLTYVRGAHRLLPYYQSTYRKSAAILAAFSHTIADLPASERDRAIDMAEVGIDPTLFSVPERPFPEGRLTFLYAGRLVPYKCPDVAIAAFAASPELRKHRLLIVGDGPERPRLEQMVVEGNLGHCVEFLGRRTQAEVGAIMRLADVFVFPSIRELGAGVVVEAMAAGLACVVVDYGAPGGLIEPDRGVKVPLGNKPELTAGFTRALEGLLEDREKLASVGSAAHEYALREYAWEAKARKTVAIYQEVLGRGKSASVEALRNRAELVTAPAE